MECCGPGYSSPQEAVKAPNEKLLYTIAIYTGTGIQKPDYQTKNQDFTIYVWGGFLNHL